MGNTKVLKKYDCTYLREAAIEVTKICTGSKPHIKKPIYGERALDLSFDFTGIAGGLGGNDFDVADFFNEDTPIRISTLSSERMIVERLEQLFGENEQFTEKIALQMKKTMINDLTQNRKEEYMSESGM